MVVRARCDEQPRVGQRSRETRGEAFDAGRFVIWLEVLVEAGAAIIDVGGESTRPGAEPVAEAEELERKMRKAEPTSCCARKATSACDIVSRVGGPSGSSANCAL